MLIANVRPSSERWKQFISNLLLWLGSVAIASSVMFFIAYNWDDLGRFAKFGLVQALIATSIIVYWFSSRTDNPISKKLEIAIPPDKPVNIVGQAALLTASLLLGVLLAFYGQTYQTGADTWQLFFTWAILIFPWVFIARFPALWIVWIALINLSAILYFQVFGGTLNIFFSSDEELIWVVAIINTVALIIWELLENRWKWLSETWAIRTLAFVSGAALTLLVVLYIFDHRSGGFPSAPITWFIGMVLVYFVYRKRKIDLFMLAMACLSGISVIMSIAGELLFDLIRAEFIGFFIMVILVTTLGAYSAKWLKAIHKESLADRNPSEGDRHE